MLTLARIFISHSSRNNDKAVELHDWLTGNGWDDVFLDIDPRGGLAPGERWQQELRKAADRCQAVLCIITPEWLASDWCRSEFLLAKTFGKRMFPITFGGVDVDKLPKDLTANDQAVDVVHDPHGWERLREGLRRAGLDPESFAFAHGRRPYPGFEPLTEDDAAVFFGREAQIVRGLDRLRSMSEAGVERMFVILGASGAGKSSYLRAGLWPRLERDDHNFLVLPVIRPERGVLTGKFGLFAALEFALGKSPTSSQDFPRSRAGIADFVSAGTDNLCRLFASLRAVSPAVLTARNVRKSPTVIMAIDQGEELFNEDGRAEASLFLDLLTGALQQDLRVIVILAIRSDSFPSLQNEAHLASVAKLPFDLPPLPATSMRLVIEGPAQVAQPAITLDPQLVEALLEDAQGADTLPLLAFTLGRLQLNFGAEGKLMLGHYERLGRVSGAVNAAVAEALAEGVRRGLLPSDKVELDDLLRETFIPHLARVNNLGQFVRRVATKADLSPRSQRVVDLFVEARLLLRDRRPTPSGDDDIVEVAHEALLRKWPTLNAWLETDREFLIGKEQLAQDIANWRDATEEQKDDALLSGLNLTRARQWLVERRALDLSAEEREYVGASITRANAQARRRRWLVGATIGVLVTIGVVLGLVDRNRRGADARAQAGAQLLVQFVTTKLIHIQGFQVNTLDAILTASKSTFDELYPRSATGRCSSNIAVS